MIVGRDSDQLTVYDRFGNTLWTRNPFGSGELRTLAVTDLDRDGLSDYAEVTPHQWYWEGEEELSVFGHLHPASTVLSGGDACGRLSADGVAYVRALRDGLAAVGQRA